MFFHEMENEGELRTVPTWNAHQLKGDRKKVWGLFITRNWRLTVQIEQPEAEIVDLDFQDYH